MMKDIDLLPQWYKNGRRKRQNLRGQYMVLAGVVVIMGVWNFIGANSLSEAGAEVYRNTQKCAEAQEAIEKTQKITSLVNNLSRKTKLLEEIDSRINIANVLSELSFLVDGRIVLSDVSMQGEKFNDIKGKKSSVAGVRVARSSSKGNKTKHLGDIRFTGTLRGIAAETSDVGKLVRKLEESEYFQDVSLAFSRSKSIRAGNKQGDEPRQVSEFEISYSLANYRIANGQSGK